MDKKSDTHAITFIDIENDFEEAKGSLYEVAERLARKKYTITFVSKKFYQHKKNITFIKIGIASAFPGITSLSYMLQLPFVLVRNVSQSYFVGENKIALLTLLLLKRKNIISIHKNTPDAIIRYFLLFIKKCIVYTEDLQQEILSINEKIKVKVIKPGVEKKYVSYPLSDSPTHIVFPCNISRPNESLYFMMRSFAKIKNKTTYELYITGKGKVSKSIQEYGKKMRIMQKTTIKTIDSDEEKLVVLSKARLFAYLDRRCDVLSPKEAIAMGVPIVCFDTPDAEWLPSFVAYKALKNNENDFARLLLHVTKQKNMKDSRKKIRKYTKKFDWEKVTKEYEAVIRQ